MPNNALKNDKLKKRSLSESDIKEIFSQRLNDLLLDRDVTAKVLAEKINVSVGIISGYRQGINTPSITKLKKIANHFNVTTDYLLGEDEYEEKGAEEIRRLLGLSSDAIDILINVYKANPNNSFTRTLNTLISEKDILANIARYLYYKMEKHPIIEFSYLYEKKTKINEKDRDFGWDIDACGDYTSLDDNETKRIYFSKIQSNLEQLIQTHFYNGTLGEWPLNTNDSKDEDPIAVEESESED